MKLRVSLFIGASRIDSIPQSPYVSFPVPFCPLERLSTLLSTHPVVFSFDLILLQAFLPHRACSHLIISVSCSHVFLRDLNPHSSAYYFLGKDSMYKMRDEMLCTYPPPSERRNEERVRFSRNGRGLDRRRRGTSGVGS